MSLTNLDISWKTNLRHETLRLRVLGSLLTTVLLFVVFLTFDTLPIDVDIPGIPDLEMTYLLYVGTMTGVVVVLAFLYSSWLLYENSPERVGLHRNGLVLGYATRRSTVAQHLWSHTVPREISWNDVQRISEPGPSGLSRDDLMLERDGETPYVIVGISADLAQTIREAFDAHSQVATQGTWKGNVPVPYP
jgi:hypothetical protein